MPNEPLAKVSLPVILRERRDRRISRNRGKFEILRSAQDDKKVFARASKVLSFNSPLPLWERIRVRGK
jgi:hypothetical protein